MSEQNKNFDYWDSVRQWPRWFRGDCSWPRRRCGIWVVTKGQTIIPCPKDIHIYKDKFWCDLVAMDVSQVKNVTIYGRSISENLKDVVMKDLTFYRLSICLPLQLNKREHSLRLYLLGSLVIIVKITCKLPRTFRVIHLIIPFDRGGDGWSNNPSV